MTTNRIATFDPAVLSRVHHAVNFTKLTSKQQIDIWHLWLSDNCELCEDVDEIKRWVEGLQKKSRGGGYPLNGREIRNILIVAQTLAYKDMPDRKTKKITVAEIERAYSYKVDFGQAPVKQRMTAENLHANKGGMQD